MRVAKNTKLKAKPKRNLGPAAPRYIRVGRWMGKHQFAFRAACLVFAILIGFSLFTQLITEILVDKNYKLTPQARQVVGATPGLYGQMLKFDSETNAYQYNADYQPGFDIEGNNGRPKFSASFSKIPEEGIKVEDRLTRTTLTFKPKFAVAPPKQDNDKLLYPIKGQNAVKVFTLQATGFKEDIILNSYFKDSLSYTYELDLMPGTEARLEDDGSVGVYGVSPALLGNVSAANEKDQELLEKARQNSVKNTLIYRIPAPFVKEFNSSQSKVNTWFSLSGNQLTIHATNLKDASYPLSIDPSVYVDTVAKLMRGNNETNIDFDVNNELIQKGSTTGARFDTLTSSMALPEARWNHGTAVAGGYIYAVGGSNGSNNQSSVYWAKLDPASHSIVSPNPGNGACTDWCTDSDYNLPSPRTAMSVVAYNGFLYVIGGKDASCSGALNICSTVYIAKLGANGEPSLWHPTDENQNNWSYWYEAGNLPSERGFSSAVAYNNRMYLLGGQTNSAAGGVNEVHFTDINPTGSLGSWTATTSLPSVRFGHSVQVYNDYLYLVGGNSGGSSLQSSVHYIKIKADGSLINNWLSTNSFSTARQSWGGNFSTIWGGYLYIAGGCATIDAQGECTSGGISGGGSIELASINADGSLSNWGTISGVNNPRIGYGLVGWRNTIYSVGGCTSQNTTTGSCNTTSSSTSYGIINQDGDASTVASSVSSGNSPCNAPSYSNCDLPGTSHIGSMLSATAIMNGHLYIIGGCTSTGCATTGNVAYVAIGSDGSLSRPAVCPSGSYQGGSWCVDNVNTISGGLLAAGTAIFNNRIYVVGGQTGGSLKGNIYHVGINIDGSLDGAWQVQSFASIGATSVSYTYAYARANPSSAGVNPGNLYIFGGCSGGATGAGCPSGSNTQAVYKCNITTSGSIGTGGASPTCTTSGQLQIGTVPGSTGTGLALHSGTVYANYIYLVGGVAPGQTDLKTLRYAKFDNNNNVVAAVGSGWAEPVDSNGDPVEMSIGRRRGTSFGYNGYLYVVGGYDAGGGGVLSDIQFAKINVSNGSLEAFKESEVTINQRWGLSVPVSSSYAFVIGGCIVGASPTCNTMTNNVQTFQLYNNDSGSPADYSSASNLFANDRLGASSTIYNGYVYVAGGCVSLDDCSDATNSVQYAPINADGSIGSWSAGGNLPADRAWGQLEQVGGTLYYVGGQNDAGTSQSTVYYTAAITGGNPTWSGSPATNGLPGSRSQHGATVWNDRIYVTGGNGSGGSCTSGVCDDVLVSPSLSSGGNISGAWSTGSTSFNVARGGHTTIAYANNLYILGGYDGSNYLNDVQFSQIQPNGDTSGWSFTTSLPAPIRQGDGFAANGYMYLFGGRSTDSRCVNKTLIAPISANTTIASGNNPTGIGEWYETNVRYDSRRYGVSANYYEGKAYLFGGGCQLQDAPIVESVTPSTFSSNTTTHNVNMPGSVAAGDLLIALFTNDGSATVSDPDGAGGWEQITTQNNGNSVRGSVWAKVATGSEGGTSVNFQTSANETAAAQVYRIAAGSWSGSLSTGVDAANGPSSTTSSPNPPGLNPAAWGAENTLWLAYAAGGTYTSISSPPSGFSDPQHSNGGTGTSGASVGSARRSSISESEDPDSFSMNASQASTTFTIAVRPAASSFEHTGNDRVVQTTLLSQPQVAKYSRMIDVDSDVFPTHWLLNGIDNAIGARWLLNYRSMTNITTNCTSPAMTTWGQDTNFGAVTLGQPEAYTPLNESGSNTNCARFYYLVVSIDSSRAFGYPEDVQRGPTITDLSLYFTSDPNKRLRHGKTFTGGELQPLDTPF